MYIKSLVFESQLCKASYNNMLPCSSVCITFPVEYQFVSAVAVECSIYTAPQSNLPIHFDYWQLHFYKAVIVTTGLTLYLEDNTTKQHADKHLNSLFGLFRLSNTCEPVSEHHSLFPQIPQSSRTGLSVNSR